MKKTYLIKYVFLLFFVLSAATVFAQTGTISGKVVDETSQPLPGATIVVKGTQKSTGTDANGNFRLTGVENGNVTLVVSFIGYQPIEKVVTVTGNVTVNFGMKTNAKDLHEVVVIGYGTQSKENVTGAITTVTQKDFQTGTVQSPEELIQGKVAGVSITTNSGEPGSGSTILIRGGASLNASNAPLIVIDGVPFSPNGIDGAANPLALVNPNDMATFTILKDAAATAIYGSRASNGVILITTKKGQAGPPVITFSTETSAATPEKLYSVLSAGQVRSLVDAYDAANPGGTDYASLLGDANTNWQKEIYRTAISSDNNLSVSGTYKTMPYRVSVGYSDENGILKTDGLQRTTTSVHLDPSFLKNTLTVNLNLNGTFQKSRFGNTAAIGDALSFNPTQPVYEANSPWGGYQEIYQTYGVPSSGINPNAPENPLAVLEQQHNTSDVYRSFGNAMITYKFPFLPALTANANFGYDVANGAGRTYAAADAVQYYDVAAEGGGDNTPYGQRIDNTTVEYYLNYTNNFKSIKSTLNAQAGYGYYGFSTTTNNYGVYSATGIEIPGSAPTFPVTPDYGYTLISYYGRLIYSYDERFTLQGSIRTDGSSKFAPSDRWGTFPAAAFAWNVINEDFLKQSHVFSDLKLRASYGVTGNEDIPEYYEYEPIYTLTTSNNAYPFGGTYYQGYTPEAYLSNITWEQTNTFNAGLDYGFFNQRLYGTVDFYWGKTKDLLAEVPLPAGSNFTNEATTNVGNTQSHGVEFSVNAIPIKTHDFSWSVNYNIAYNRVIITNLYLVPDPSNPGDQVGGISGGTGNYVEINSVNHSPNDFYVYQQVYGPNGKPLEGVYVDRNGDGTVNASDEYHDHNAYAPIIMGFSTQFTYKRWSLSTVLRAELGNYVYNNVEASDGTYGALINNTGVVDNASTAIYATGFKGYDYLSDYYVQNASFLRMDNLGLGYNFGQIFRDKHINLRVTANAQNVFVITKYQGLDPEVVGGIDNNTYPRPRTYTLGLNLSL